ncbi:primosomal protein N' [bacterium]|nr:primosomal protein N' [bacterium]
MTAKGKNKTFAHIVLAIDSRKMQDLYTYAIPQFLKSQVRIGTLVLVPVRNSLRRGIVVELTDKTPTGDYKTKNIISVYGPETILDETGIEIARWIARYYHSSLYSAVRLLFWDLKTFKIETEYTIGNPSEFLSIVYDKIGLFGKPKKQPKLEGKLTKRKLKAVLKSCEVYAAEQDELIDEFLEKGIIRPSYHLARGKTRSEKFTYQVSEHKPVDISPTPKQEEILLAVSDYDKPVTWDEIKKQFPNGRRHFNALLKNGFLSEIHVPETRETSADYDFELTKEQKKAVDEISYSIEHGLGHSFLLEGVTGSGKTEVYIECTKNALHKGSVIVLVPEIVLTMQIVQRFKQHFGDNLFVLHSGLGQAQLKRNWEVLRGSEKRIVIGPRSALFAPLTDVKLIVIDEEHEPAFKQERAPRYHARDVARKMSQMRKATLVLGSATPSVETRHLADRDIHSLLELTKRIYKGGLPHVEMVKLTGGNAEGVQFMTPYLVNALRKTLDRGKQALLFLNQRGFSPSIVCRSCGYTPRCPDCDISFTYHARDNMLLCHHCDRKMPVPRNCYACGSDQLLKIGFGTQRVEQEVSRYFPDAKIYRLDKDVASRGGIDGGSLALMNRFFKEHGDILIGTQMIGKGLDLPDVELVGIISADTSLNLPDFRAAERTFQLVTQVAGRAGRRDIKGVVVLQTYQTGHYAIDAARRQDYELFFEKEIKLRKRLGYPPFASLARIVFRGSNDSDVRSLADNATAVLKDLERRSAIKLIGILGPCPAPLGRIAGKYRHHLILKAKNVDDLINAVSRMENRMKTQKGAWMDIDINPLNML